MSASVPVVIAVVSWNTRELLGACLSSLASYANAAQAAVWVVDNGSTDGSTRLVREHHAWANLLETDNKGFGAAVNLVAANTTSDWIAAANADVALRPGSLETLLAAGAAMTSAGAIAPRLVQLDGSTQVSVAPFPTLKVALAGSFGLGTLAPRLADRLLISGRLDTNHGFTVDWAWGAFLLVRRAAWDQVGGFDERHWLFAEDMDLCWRLSKAGWRTYYEPTAIVEHVGGAATTQLWGDGVGQYWMRSTYAWILRHRGAMAMRVIALVNLLGAVRRALFDVPRALLAGEHPWAHPGWRSARDHAVGLLPRAELERHR